MQNQLPGKHSMSATTGHYCDLLPLPHSCINLLSQSGSMVSSQNQSHTHIFNSFSPHFLPFYLPSRTSILIKSNSPPPRALGQIKNTAKKVTCFTLQLGPHTSKTFLTNAQQSLYFSHIILLPQIISSYLLCLQIFNTFAIFHALADRACILPHQENGSNQEIPPPPSKFSNFPECLPIYSILPIKLAMFLANTNLSVFLPPS